MTSTVLAVLTLVCTGFWAGRLSVVAWPPARHGHGKWGNL